MANKRTVDPDASEASAHIIGIRVTPKQLEEIGLLCQARGMQSIYLIIWALRGCYSRFR